MKSLMILLALSLFVGSKNTHCNEQQGFINFSNTKKLYIVCRSTTSKSALIAQKFNLKDKKITHCGLGFFSKKGFEIYNVTDVTKNKKRALIIDSWDTFSKIDGVYYIGVWELNISNFPLNEARSLCNEYVKKEIFFDYDFKIGNNNSFYCSEFCAFILNNINFKNIHFEPEVLKIEDKLYRSFLNRETLIYFPVDFFQNNTMFKKVYEFENK